MSGDAPQAHPHLGGGIRYCVSCGSPLTYRAWTEGDGSMQLCCTSPECRHVHFLDPKLAAGIVPAVDGRAVLLQRAYNPGKGLWTFPGGFVNRGEVVAEAAAREAAEEAGIEVRLGPLLGVYSFEGQPTVLVVYAGQVTRGEPRALDESLAVKLVAPGEVDPAELAFDTTRAAMRDWQTWMATGRVPAAEA